MLLLRRHVGIAIAAAVSAALAGCAVNEAGVNYGQGILNPDRTYFENRALDLADIVTINVGAGLGLAAEVHATHLAALGAGIGKTWDFGLSERPRQYGLWEDALTEASAGPFGWGCLTHTFKWGHTQGEDFDGRWGGLQTSLDPVYQKERDYWAVGGSATLGVISAQIEVHPLQVFDFVTGLWGWDALADEF
jgi:hypothetical protein